MPAKETILLPSRLFRIASLLLMLPAFWFPLQRARAQDALRSTIDSLAGEYIRSYPATSLSIGISSHGKITFYYYAGKAAPQMPDSSSLYEIGGITETYTSVLFADLCLKGILTIDAPLARYLPVNVSSPVYQPVICRPTSHEPEEPASETSKSDAFLRIHFSPFTCTPDPSAQPQPVLLCYLSTHTSGLPEYPGNLKWRKHKDNPMATYRKEDLYDFLRDYQAGQPVGFDYRHSPLGIALLGHAMSLAMHAGFDSLLTERLLIPMGLADTRMALSANQTSRFLPGYTQKGKPAQHWTYDVFSPAAGLRSSPADMMHFLDDNIRAKDDSLSHLLAYTHNSRLSMAASGDTEEIALGWRISPLGSERVVWQAGLTGGFAAYIGFTEKTHAGIVVLSNSAASVDALGKTLLQTIH